MIGDKKNKGCKRQDVFFYVDWRFIHFSNQRIGKIHPKSSF